MRKYQRGQDQYLLRRLVKCGVCGRSMQRQKGGPRVYYICDKSRANKAAACPVGERFYEEELERVVRNDLLEKLHLLVEANDSLHDAEAASKGTEENLRFQLEQTEKRLKQISVSRISGYERYAEGKLGRAAYLAERDKLSTENDRLQEKKKQLEKELASLIQSRSQAISDTAQKAQDVLSAESLTNEMLLFFIDRINVYTGMRIEIIYRFTDEVTALIGSADSTASS